MSTFCVGDLVAEPGKKVSGFLPSENIGMPDGTGNYWNIPVIIVNGVEEGSIFEVDGCIHGEEQEGAYIVLELIRRLNPKKLKGTFIGVPILNGPGFQTYRGTRGCIADQMYVDMNRQFPGDPESMSITCRAIHTFWKEIIKKCDYTVNLHGCMMKQIPRVVFNEEMQETLEMAKAIAHTSEWIIASKSEHTKLQEKTINRACTEAGIPNVFIESGTNSRDYSVMKTDIDTIVSGIENCMKKYNMLEGKVEIPKSWKRINYYTHVRGKTSGIIYPEPNLKINTMVKKGDLLCKIVDFLGKEIEQIHAPHDGIILLEPSHVSVGPDSQISLIGYPPVEMK